MLERLVLSPSSHQFANWRQLRFGQIALEFQVNIEPFPPERMRQQMLRIQARIFDPALLKIRSRRLQDFENRHDARYPGAVIPSRAGGEESHIVRTRLLRWRDPSPSARLRMTTNEEARRISIMRSARCPLTSPPDRPLAGLK